MLSGGTHRTLQDVEAYIRRRLIQELTRALKTPRLVTEADVEAAAYSYLHHFLGDDAKWHVLARKHARLRKHFDLVVFRKTIPVFAIELKWGMRRDREERYGPQRVTPRPTRARCQDSHQRHPANAQGVTRLIQTSTKQTA